jgi:hypothetical protein
MRDEHRPMRVTPTNAGPDSKGVVSVFGWELEGLTAFYLIGGALASFGLAFVLNRWPFGQRVVASLVPAGAAALWIKFFVHGRPPAYQRDVIERWIWGRTFRLRPRSWLRWRHPRKQVETAWQDRELSHG